MREDTVVSKLDYFDILPAGIIVIRPDYTVVCWNRTIAEWTGIHPGEIVGHDLRQRFPRLKNRRYEIRIQQVFEGGPAAFFSTQFHPHFIDATLPQGGLRFQRTSIHSIMENGDNLAIIVIDDVTDLVSQVHAFREMKNRALHEVEERKRTEIALQEANRQLKLLSGMTRHDILNSITAAVGYLDLAAESSDSEKEVFLDKVYATLEKIQRQIEFTRTYEILGSHQPIWHNLHSLISELGVPETIKLKTSGLDVDIIADPMLKKVFENLLDNTLRHGGDTVSGIELEGNVHGEEFRLIWSDNGSGIDPGEKEKIFERGYGKNTGLGLFMIREILAITGITIEETGVEGGGARFEIHVPPGEWKTSEGD